MKIVKIGISVVLFSCHTAFLIAEVEIVPDLTVVGDGEILDVINYDEIETSGVVTVENGGDAVFWSGTKVTLKPGFSASPNSVGYFQASIDTNFDGFSDVQESFDSDGDGLFDAWELANGFDPFVSNGTDIDGDGVSNASELALGRDPTVSENGYSSSTGLPYWFSEALNESAYNGIVTSGIVWIEPGDSGNSVSLFVDQPN